MLPYKQGIDMSLPPARCARLEIVICDDLCTSDSQRCKIRHRGTPIAVLQRIVDGTNRVRGHNVTSLVSPIVMSKSCILLASIAN